MFKKIFWGFVCFWQVFNSNGQPIVDSLLRVLQSTKDTAKVDVMIDLGKEFVYIDHKKAIQYSTEALNLAQKLNYLSGIGKVYSLLGGYYCIQGAYLKALQYYKLSIEIWTMTNNQLRLAYVYSDISDVYLLTSQYEKALQENLRALNILEKLKNVERAISNCYTSIGHVYFRQKKYQLSIEYHSKSLKIDLKRNDISDITCDYANIAKNYGALRQFQKALSFYDSIVPVCQEHQYNYLLSITFGNFGEFCIELKQYDKAYEYLKKSLYYSALINNKIVICSAYSSLGKLFILKNQPDSAISILLRNLPLVKECKQFDNNAEYYIQLSLAYEKSFNYRKALEYYKIYSAYQDSFNQKGNSERILELETRYEVDAKESQIKLLNKDNELKNVRLARQKIFIFSVIISLFLTAILALVLFNRFRIKRKANKELEQKNLEIEEQKQEIITINEQLSAHSEELKELDQVKSRFFTNISHEFRTPLTLIIGPLETLLPKTNDEKLKVEYQIMLRQAKRLLTLVNQLLELSKLEKRMMQIRVSMDNFNRFLRTIVSSYTSFAIELDIELNFIEDITEQELWFDKDKVEKIITNLVTNACKFTESGGKVEVILRNSLSNNKMIEIVVRDTGVGIGTESLKHIFDPFYQADSTLNSREGSGIGLALVRELVLLHHGSISVNSIPGKGSEFIIQLPTGKEIYQPEEITTQIEEYEIIGRDDLTTVNPLNEGVPSFGSKGNRKDDGDKTIVLIVEDNEDMRHYVRANLPPEYQIAETVNGEEGIEKANEIIPDLIIADIMMPRMNGLEMTRKIKQDKRTSHIPVIILTAKASEENKIEGLDTLADDYVTKPFNIQELTLRIRNLIANRQTLRDKFAKSITVNPSEITSSSLDEQFLCKALQIVEKNMDNGEYNPEKFGEDIGMSRSNLHRKLTALTGQSATEFIRTIRLKRAAQLLKQKAGTVSEIADKTGFNSLSYFTTCFKEQFKVSPSEFIKT